MTAFSAQRAGVTSVRPWWPADVATNRKESSRQNYLWRIPRVSTLANAGDRDPKFARPFAYALRSSVVRDERVASRVIALFPLRCPSHVPGLVVAVLVWVAIKRMFLRRPRANVGREVVDRVNPTLAYGDAPPAVGWVIWARRVQAPLLHSVPHLSQWVSTRRAHAASPFTGGSNGTTGSRLQLSTGMPVAFLSRMAISRPADRSPESRW